MIRKRTVHMLALALSIIAGNMASAAEESLAGGKDYSLWDGKESVAEYAKRAKLEPEVAMELGDGVKMELVLIPAGKFFMGSPKDEINRFDNEGPQHEVTIGKPFYMGKFEVTQEQYEKLINKNPSHFKGARNPVENVSWDDAQEFCKKLGQKTDRTVRLPTEAEWEHACRAGSMTPYHPPRDYEEVQPLADEQRRRVAKLIQWLASNIRVTMSLKEWQKVHGIPRPTINICVTPSKDKLPDDVEITTTLDVVITTLPNQDVVITTTPNELQKDLGILRLAINICITMSQKELREMVDNLAWIKLYYLKKVAWFSKNSGMKTNPVGKLRANIFGLYDMHGNVWEWVEDDWHNNFIGSPADGRAWVENTRGIGRVVRGGFWNLDPEYCRSAYRTWFSPALHNNYSGFRVAISPPSKP